MGFVEFVWLHDECSLKDALKSILHCSGQLLKRHYSSKELDRPQEARVLIKIPVDLVNHLKINPLYIGPPSIIIKETSEYIAVHKPPGIHSHPLCYSDQDTLLNYLASIGKWAGLQVNEGSYDRGLLYRLDYETSGVMVLAKTNEFHQNIRDNFSGALRRKLYWAVVAGEFNQEGEWTHYFLPTGFKGSKQKVSDWPKGGAPPGTMMVRKVLYEEGRSLLLIDLKTGHRHQIRAQLSHLGFPILGDELYGGRAAGRLFLHALRYDWGEVVEDPCPELFHCFLDLDRALKMSHDMLRSF